MEKSRTSAGQHRRPRATRTVRLDGHALTLEQVEQVAAGSTCKLTRQARSRVRNSRAVVERAVRSGSQVYGVNTGFGKLARVSIPHEDLEQLQTNLIRSHACGVGEPLPDRVVRAVLCLRANCLARGHSGIRVETLQSILDLLDAGIHPVVPRQGSVGASGDLAPLAHIALALIGEGEVHWRGKRMSARRALSRAGIEPVQLAAKEGLALINGTQVSTAIGTLALLAAEQLTATADIVGAMTLEALCGSHRAFAKRIHDARPQVGQKTSAANLRRLLRRSEINRSHAACGEVQDCYSLRCIPQVHGAVRDALSYVRSVLAIEINASTDNPMVFPETGEMISAGNFHGQPVAIVMDQLAIAVSGLATISERRTERLLNPDLSGLPAFLTHNPGLNSGFMMAHVTAAALTSENKVLAHPASVDSIPTSAAKEDHVPMATHAARKAARIVDHVTTVLAVEAMAAAQALDMLRPLTAGQGVEAAQIEFRRHVRQLKRDRVLSVDIERARRLIAEQRLRLAAEAAVGKLS
jgi:histidine ammonia-lyase